MSGHVRGDRVVGAALSDGDENHVFADQKDSFTLAAEDGADHIFHEMAEKALIRSGQFAEDPENAVDNEPDPEMIAESMCSILEEVVDEIVSVLGDDGVFGDKVSNRHREHFEQEWGGAVSEGTH